MQDAALRFSRRFIVTVTLNVFFDSFSVVQLGRQEKSKFLYNLNAFFIPR